MNKVFDKIIEKLEEEKMSYFLTIANTRDEKLDCAYEQVGDALDKAIEIVKAGGNADLLIDKAKSKSGERIPYDGKWK